MRCIHADKLRQHNPLKKTGLHYSVALFFFRPFDVKELCIFFLHLFIVEKRGLRNPLWKTEPLMPNF